VRGMHEAHLFTMARRQTMLYSSCHGLPPQGNVILVSSDHAFPFGLTREPIGFNLDNFTGFLFGGYVWISIGTCCGRESQACALLVDLCVSFLVS
jgi:hypothetical protein